MSQFQCLSDPIHFYDVIAPPSVTGGTPKAHPTHHRHHPTTCTKQNAKTPSANISKTLHSPAHLKKKPVITKLKKNIYIRSD